MPRQRAILAAWRSRPAGQLISREGKLAGQGQAITASGTILPRCARRCARATTGSCCRRRSRAVGLAEAPAGVLLWSVAAAARLVRAPSLGPGAKALLLPGRAARRGCGSTCGCRGAARRSTARPPPLQKAYRERKLPPG
jgi:hypothetical protein